MSRLAELFRTVVMRIGFAVVLAGALTVALATTAFRGSATTAISPTLASSSSSCGYGGSPCEDKLVSGMNAKQVKPGPGQAGASGRAQLTANEEHSTMCMTLTVKPVMKPITDVAIHKGAVGHVGATVINFGSVTVSKAGTAAKCASSVSSTLIEAIEAHPGLYYMQVNTGAHPGGAIRGQLQKAN